MAGAHFQLVNRNSGLACIVAARAMRAANRVSPAFIPCAVSRTPIFVNSSPPSAWGIKAPAPMMPNPSASMNRISPPLSMMAPCGFSRVLRSAASSVNMASIHAALMSWKACASSAARSGVHRVTVAVGMAGCHSCVVALSFFKARASPFSLSGLITSTPRHWNPSCRSSLSRQAQPCSPATASMIASQI